MSEMNIRQSVDDTLFANLNLEANRARAAERILQESISSEITDRQIGDEELLNEIDMKAIDERVLHVTGDESVDGHKAFTQTIIANISGNAGSVNNGVYSSDVYDNPDWILSLSSDKVIGTIPIDQIDNLTCTLNAKAMDNAVVHRINNEMISGTKTFSSTVHWGRR